MTDPDPTPPATNDGYGSLGLLADALAMMAVENFSEPLPSLTGEQDDTVMELWTAAELLRQDLQEVARRNRESALRTAAYNGFLAALNEAGDDPEEIVKAVAALLNNDYVGICSVLVPDESGEQFILASIFHRDPALNERLNARLSRGMFAVSEGFAGQAYTSGKTVFVPDIGRPGSADQIPDRVRWVNEVYPLSSAVVAPIRVGQRALGVVGAYRGAEMRHMNELDVDLIANVAERLGAALERADQHAELARIRRELQESNAKLARSNQDLNEFAFVASHDLQEPLRVVVSFTSLLTKRNPDLDEKSSDYIRRAQSAAIRMQTLINDLLTYSRVGTADVEFVAVSTPQIVAEVIDDLSERIRESGATVNVGQLPTVSGDSVQLHQLFQNLIGNALKYAGDQPPVVDVTAHRDPADPSYWQFTVADNGIGFDPKFAERIFVIFQRLHARNAYSGTGIGLAVCKRVVARHGGRIWAESQPGVGSAFQFTLREAP